MSHKTSIQLAAEIGEDLFDKMIRDAVSTVMEPEPRSPQWCARGMVCRSGRQPKAANAAAGSITQKR